MYSKNSNKSKRRKKTRIRLIIKSHKFKMWFSLVPRSNDLSIFVNVSTLCFGIDIGDTLTLPGVFLKNKFGRMFR